MPRHVELVESLRQSGHRLTPQRESVLAVIAASDHHLTAEEIIEQVRERYPYLNKSAVYRSLDLLTELGLVTQIDLGHGHAEYELHNHPHHHHLVCRHCKHVQQIDHKVFTAMGKKLERDFGFQADLDHFAIFGTCKKCQPRAAKVSKRRAH
jgi:Fur family transcriptional regulator, ferric uptake regulator